jgi:fructose-1,6-bisphosphatase/inositol monophosphatase family enzyme
VKGNAKNLMSPTHPDNLEALRLLLCDLQNSIRDALIVARSTQAAAGFAEIADVTEADTIYAIDKVSEETILQWFESNWPVAQPVEIVMEGIEEGENVIFPCGISIADTVWKCILDPIDGTRGIMYDKRSAWSLAALAPQKGIATRLSDILVAAMSELPTSKAWRADQISGVRGCGSAGLVCDAINVFDGKKTPLTLQPSSKSDFKHGFASTSRFFPEGKSLMSKLEEDLWDELYGLGSTASPLVFDDQYICSGGQMYEVMAGHDRMVGDLRPLAYAKLGFDSSLVCHPYDVCTCFLLQEAGGIVEEPDGSPLDGPLDTISSVCWMGYANETLAAQVRPILKRLIEYYL